MIKKEVQLSSEFKSQTVRAITAIIIFFIVYILIFTLALGLTALCVYGGIMLVAAAPRLITLALGIGLASLGFLVLFFLLKFIFKNNKMDRSHLFEISQKSEPILFKMINQIVEEVGTSFPKKIYLSTDVNASVFYDSTFWSMFLPIKKNLVIGLGLVNSINKEEFKAILSHEFGHFSQKTMKVGSYVYNVNQIIFNMLYDNDSYDDMIKRWANASGYFTVFVIIAVKIVEGIQWILRKMYEFVNKEYMGLSREMEFHADEIAANITGYEPLRNSLLRMNLADYSFNTVLSFYEGKVSNNVKSQNIYKEQLYLINFTARDDKLTIENGLPKITLEDLNKLNKSKLIIKDQWASHPTLQERIEKLEKTNIVNKNLESSLANELFQDILKIQEKLTNKMFSEIKYDKAPKTYSLEEFKAEYEIEYSKNTYSKLFNGYYDSKNPIQFEINEINKLKGSQPFSELFNDKKVNLNYMGLALQNDIDTIKQISDKTLKIKSFDYDGKKYLQKDSDVLLLKLQDELTSINDSIKDNDIAIFQFFQTFEPTIDKSSRIAQLYKNFFDFDKEYDIKIETYTKLSDELQFINLTTPFDVIKTNFKNAKNLENGLKENIKQLIIDPKYSSEITKEIKTNFDAYLSEELSYFGNEAYIDKNLEILFGSLNDYAFLLSRGYFLNKKELLDYKVSLIEKTTHNNV
jgi:Zn-dependent protease with chaperone function